MFLPTGLKHLDAEKAKCGQTSAVRSFKTSKHNRGRNYIRVVRAINHASPTIGYGDCFVF
jgi:hypothetical protein